MRRLLTAAFMIQILTAQAFAASDCERFVAAQLSWEEKALALICAGKSDEEAQPEIDAYIKKTYPEWTFGPYPFEITRLMARHGACTTGLSPLRKDLVKMRAMCIQQKWDLAPYRSTAVPAPQTPTKDVPTPQK